MAGPRPGNFGRRQRHASDQPASDQTARSQTTESPTDGELSEDIALFRQAVRDVTPLQASRRVEPPAQRVRGRAQAARRARATALEPPGRRTALRDRLEIGTDLYQLQPGEELQFRRTGVPQTTLRALRRGDHRAESEIDLHGLTGETAAARLEAFLRLARARELRCVRIIHGKGLRSGTRGPVIKNLVNVLLRQSAAVLAFASAPPTAGGTGATLVLLARG